VTTILKAFQEIERRNMPGEPTTVMSVPERRSYRLVLWAVVPLVIGAVAVALFSTRARAPEALVHPDPPPGAAPIVQAKPVSEAPAQVQPRPMVGGDVPPAWGRDRAAPASDVPAKVPPRMMGRGDAAPWGKIQDRAAPAPPVAERVAVAPPARKVEARTQPAVPPRAKTRSASPSAEAADPTDFTDPEPEAPRVSSSGTPRIDVRAISFSPDATRRHVTLRIDGGPPMVMNEGESARGVEVQLILSDVVYVRHGGNILSVGVTR
jgi:hypothetical protein